MCLCIPEIFLEIETITVSCPKYINFKGELDKKTQLLLKFLEL